MKSYVAAGFGAFAAIAFLLPAAASAATIQVSITDNIFTPKTITINAGDAIIWTNNGSMAHTVTSDDGSFNSGSIAPGTSFVHIYNTAGTFAYHCLFHGASGGGGMAATVLVVGPTGSATTTPQTAPTQPAVPSAYEQQVASLKVEITVLTQVLANLVRQRAGIPTNVGSACYAITTMGPGASGASVSQLQQFLARDSVVYPEAQITGYYGSLTQAAVKRFQLKNAIDGTGTVGPQTLAAIQSQCGSASASSNGSQSSIINPTGPVGGFIQVSPVNGTVPLSVSIQASVNTTNDCGGATYTLDFGDGSQQQQITVAPGTCQTLQQTYTHTYTGRGTYSVILSAGTHQATATITAQ